ncbi:MAG: GNAT family N-acetyltransferase [Rhizobiaceae bacterium]
MPEPVITIRVAMPRDAEALSALIAASYATLARAGYDADELTAALPSMSIANPKLLASGTYYVVEVDGEPAACGGWTREAPGKAPMTDGVAHIRHFATHPAHLRKGLAKMLLDRCVAEAAAAGLKALQAQSTLLAEPFYAAAGFRRIGRGRARMGPEASLPVVEMERKLP